MFEIIETKYDYKFVIFILFFFFFISLIGIYFFSYVNHKIVDVFPLLLFSLIIGGFTSIFALFTSKKATAKISLTNKNEFIYDIDFLLNKIGCHKISGDSDTILYRFLHIGFDRFNRITITIKENEAYITTTYSLIKKLKRVYAEEEI